MSGAQEGGRGRGREVAAGASSGWQLSCLAAAMQVLTWRLRRRSCATRPRCVPPPPTTCGACRSGLLPVMAVALPREHGFEPPSACGPFSSPDPDHTTVLLTVDARTCKRFPRLPAADACRLAPLRCGGRVRELMGCGSSRLLFNNLLAISALCLAHEAIQARRGA